MRNQARTTSVLHTQRPAEFCDLCGVPLILRKLQEAPEIVVVGSKNPSEPERDAPAEDPISRALLLAVDSSSLDFFFTTLESTANTYNPLRQCTVETRARPSGFAV